VDLGVQRGEERRKYAYSSFNRLRWGVVEANRAKKHVPNSNHWLG